VRDEVEGYDPSDDRYLSNPFYEPEFDPEGDDGPPMDREYVRKYRDALKRYEARCKANAL
jgi:hypothetical protein